MISSMDKKAPHPWWFDGHGTQRRSMWLQSTLSDLDRKTMAMLKMIETDADSFGQRAEMYYKKRPELISMVEDFYRTHRSLAERFDTLKSEPRTRLLPSLGLPLSPKGQLNKPTFAMEKPYDIYSETYSQCAESEVDDDPEQVEETPDRKAGTDEESAESEIDDPEPEDGSVDDMEIGVVSNINEIEIMKLRDEIKRLKEENKIQKEQLLQKDEEKREVIRQLSLSMEILRENVNPCKRSTGKGSSKNWCPLSLETLKENASPCKRSTGKELSKKWGPFEFSKIKGFFGSQGK